MEAILRDLRLGARALLLQPALSAVLVLSLALGIGANTALFSVADALLLRSLPVAHPEQLALLSWDCPAGLPAQSLSGSISFDASSTSFSFPAFALLRRQAASVAEVFAFTSIDRIAAGNAGIGGQAELIDGQAVSGNYFSALGVRAAAGRLLGPEDDVPGAPPAAVIGHGFWRRRFGADPGVVGRSLTLNGSAFTVVGVTERGFAGTLQVGSDPEVTVPIAQHPLVRRNGPSLADIANWWLQVMVRPRPDQPRARVLTVLEPPFQASLADLPPPPEIAPGASAAERVVRLHLAEGGRGLDDQRQSFHRPVAVLMALVGAVLLIACTNVAGLLLVRAVARRREIATRLAVGGSRARVVRQLLTEGLVLALAGGALGLLAALWGQDLLLRLLQRGPAPLALDLGLDLRLLAVTAGIALASGLALGIAPALRATRLDLASELKGTPDGRSGRLRPGRALVVAQVALALPLLVGAGLFAGTLRSLHGVSLGFDPEGVLVFRLDPTLNGYKRERLAGLYTGLQERLAALPGVRSASFSSYTLLSGSSGMLRLEPEPGAPVEKQRIAYFQVVQEDFLHTMKIPVLRGRGFTAADAEDAPPVAVISRRLARELFGGRDPLGQKLPPTFGREDMRVVGVAGDARYTSLRQEAPATLYLPYRQNTNLLGTVTFEVRTAGDPAAAIPAIRREVAALLPDLPLFDLRTQTDVAASSLAQERLFASLSGFFGILSALLAALGLYGTMAYAVVRRTRETGIRIALGARRGSVVWRVLREALLLAAAGAVLGLGAALAGVRLVEGLLFGLAPTDPRTLAVATFLLLAVAALAGYLPARRASRVDPLVALRTE